MTLDRRSFLAAAMAIGIPASGAMGATLQMPLPGEYGKRLRSARYTAFHLHNEPKGSTLHTALETMWFSVYEKTDGALMVTVLPLDANLPLGDAEAVANVAAGRFGFVSAAAPILDQMVPDIGLQTLPFTYRNVADVLAMIDQPAFSQLMDKAMAPANLAYLPGGTFSNGFRIIASTKARPIRTLDDLNGLRIRVPPSADIALLFRTLGAAPVVTPISGIRDAFVSGTVDAEENPPAIISNFDLQSVTHWINVTNHIWTGFNTLASLDFWNALPAAVRDVVLTLLPQARNAQVTAQEAANADVTKNLDLTGSMEVIMTDVSDARQRVAPVYAAMLEKFSPAARQIAEPLLARSAQAEGNP